MHISDVTAGETTELGLRPRTWDGAGNIIPEGSGAGRE
jgi:hypothetical protein